MTEYTLGFCFSHDKKEVALIRKNRPDWQKGLLNGIGGRIEAFDKHPKQAMTREFHEETTVYQVSWSHFATMEFPGGRVYCFVSYCDLSMLQTATDEEVVIVDAKKINELQVVDNVRLLVPMALWYWHNYDPVIIREKI